MESDGWKNKHRNYRQSLLAGSGAKSQGVVWRVCDLPLHNQFSLRPQTKRPTLSQHVASSRRSPSWRAGELHSLGRPAGKRASERATCSPRRRAIVLAALSSAPKQRPRLSSQRSSAARSKRPTNGPFFAPPSPIVKRAPVGKLAGRLASL